MQDERYFRRYRTQIIGNPNKTGLGDRVVSDIVLRSYVKVFDIESTTDALVAGSLVTDTGRT